MEFDLLYFDDCSSWQAGLENLKAALEAEEIRAENHMVEATGDATATQFKFLAHLRST